MEQPHDPIGNFLDPDREQGESIEDRFVEACFELRAGAALAEAAVLRATTVLRFARSQAADADSMHEPLDDMLRRLDQIRTGLTEYAESCAIAVREARASEASA